VGGGVSNLWRDSLIRALERRSAEDLERLALRFDTMRHGKNAARIVRAIAQRKLLVGTPI
jgi:hypothetical protein